MVRNYFKTAIRNIIRHKGYAFINILGLAIGIVCCILIFLYVADEFSYDRQFQNADRIFRLIDYNRSDDSPYAAVPPKWTEMLKAQYPEILASVRIRRLDLFAPLISHGERGFYENDIWFADSTFFTLFDFEFVQGSRENALNAPNALVISEAAAKKYFDNQNAIGQIVTYNQEADLQITGVVKVPANTHLQFDMIRRFPDPDSRWWVRSYFLLAEQTNPSSLAGNIGSFLAKNYTLDDGVSFQFKPEFQPLPDIHLHSEAQWELGPNGNITYLYILVAIAVLILAVACINFMNLATARSMDRAREVGMRKVLGAHRRQIALQFLGESILMAFAALILSLALIELMLPAFEAFTGKSLLGDYRAYIWQFGSLGGITLLTGLLAGIYPAVFLSGFQPVHTLKGKLAAINNRGYFRKLLVVSQFAISMMLLIGTGVIYQQLDYMQNKPLGFEKEHVITLTSRDRTLNQRYESAKAELLNHPNILNVAFAQGLPGRRITSFRYTLPGNEPYEFGMTAFATDHDFIKTMGIELVAGRDFSTDFGNEHESFILNEAAVKALGWENPVGREIGVTYFNKMGRVVGVVKDFHYNSLHEAIGPAAIQVMPPGFYSKIALRVRTENLGQTLAFLSEKWQQLSPDYPFDYHFLNQDLAARYQADQKLGEIFSYFAAIAIAIACLGLFGLSAFAAEQRTKEIGIRKVLGASIPNVIALLSKDFIKLVVLANLFAWPLAWFAMNRWLEGFAYRIDIAWWIFLLSGSAVLFVALLTVAYQAVSAALVNPVASLKCE